MSEVLVPEIIPAGVPVVARPSPFSFDRVELTVPEGTALSQVVERMIEQPWLRSWACVAVDGLLIPPWALPFHRTQAGERVTVTVIPRGGGGSNGGGKNTWAVVLSVVVILAATGLTAYAGGYGGVGAALGASGAWAAPVGAVVVAGGTMAALLAINALLPPLPRPAEER